MKAINNLQTIIGNDKIMKEDKIDSKNANYTF